MNIRRPPRLGNIGWRQAAQGPLFRTAIRLPHTLRATGITDYLTNGGRFENVEI
jgi:hypothetical protein